MSLFRLLSSHAGFQRSRRFNRHNLARPAACSFRWRTRANRPRMFVSCVRRSKLALVVFIPSARIHVACDSQSDHGWGVWLGVVSGIRFTWVLHAPAQLQTDQDQGLMFQRSLENLRCTLTKPFSCVYDGVENINDSCLHRTIFISGSMLGWFVFTPRSLACTFRRQDSGRLSGAVLPNLTRWVAIKCSVGVYCTLDVVFNYDSYVMKLIFYALHGAFNVS